MYDKTPFFYGTGRRKSSVARVRLYKGTGKIVINNREIDDYFGLDTLKVIVRQPLELTGLTDRFDVVCNVTGGGVTGQAGAIRHGIARALLQYDTEIPRSPEEPPPCRNTALDSGSANSATAHRKRFCRLPGNTGAADCRWM